MNRHRPVIAVVDDDPRLLESLADLLESAGYRPRCFPSAKALLAGGLPPIDLLITDIGMPDIDGFELREIVETSRPDVPVLLISGRYEIGDSSGDHIHSVFFRKPFDGQALLAAIGSALLHRKMGGHNGH